jgi:hypothetical protein
MTSDQIPHEINAALAGVRRRARLLDQASARWSWRDLQVAEPGDVREA